MAKPRPLRCSARQEREIAGSRFREAASKKRMRRTTKRKLTARKLIQKFPRLQRKANCLTDIACPGCGNREEFRIEMKSMFTLRDDGTDGYEDTEWGQGNYCRCGQCQHEGKVRDFTFPGLEALLASAHESKG